VHDRADGDPAIRLAACGAEFRCGIVNGPIGQLDPGAATAPGGEVQGDPVGFFVADRLAQSTVNRGSNQGETLEDQVKPRTLAGQPQVQVILLDQEGRRP